MRTGIRQKSRDVQERNPRQVLEQRSKERAVPEAILQQRVPDVSSTRKDDRAREPDLETVQEEAVDVRAPAEEEVVHERERKARRDTVYIPTQKKRVSERVTA